MISGQNIQDMLKKAYKAEIWRINIENSSGKIVATVKWDASKYKDIKEIFGISPKDSLIGNLIFCVREHLEKCIDFKKGVKK